MKRSKKLLAEAMMNIVAARMLEDNPGGISWSKPSETHIIPRKVVVQFSRTEADPCTSSYFK